jgi:DNA-binding transcriptional LysR family regulator
MDAHTRDLRYFVAVADRLHFTQAAEDLHVSQPALSKQIRALEAQLGLQLFERDRRTVRLTAAGVALLPAARATLAAWSDTARIVRRERASRDDGLRIGFSTGVGRGIVPALRARLSAIDPPIPLTLHQVAWSDPSGGVRPKDRADDAEDAAFVWLPVPVALDLDTIVVATEPPVLALPAAHPLAAGPADEPIPFASLLEEAFVALPETSGVLRDHWLARDARGRRAAVIGAEAASIEETVEAVASGLGVCLVAAGNAPFVDREGVVIRPLSGVEPSRLALVWRRGDERAKLRALRAAISELIASG